MRSGIDVFFGNVLKVVMYVAILVIVVLAAFLAVCWLAFQIAGVWGF